MRGIIRKELREHVRLALGVALLASAVFGFALWREGPDTAWKALASERFQTVTVFGCALAALAFGFFGTAGERRRGSWALLVHRPLSRSAIFAGKACAGLGMYALALGLPLAAALVWCALPGRIAAPFEPALALGAACDLCAGAGYYFAGMLVGTRDARWLGTRLVPVAGAAGFHFLAAAAPELWQAAIVLAVGASALGAAAWGVYVEREGPKLARAAAHFALGVALVAGTVFGGALVVVLGEAYWPADSEPRVAHHRFVDYRIVDDGHIVRFVGVDDGVESVVDLDGTPRPELAADVRRPPWDRPRTQSFTDLPTTAPPRRPRYADYRRPARYLDVLQEVNDLAVVWTFDAQRGRIAGYERARRTAAASLGPEGFAAEGAAPAGVGFAPDTSFCSNGSRTGGVLFGSQGAWAVDFATRAFAPIAALMGKALVAARVLPDTPSEGPHPIVLAGADGYFVVDGGAVVFAAALPEPHPTWLGVGPLVAGRRSVRFGDDGAGDGAVPLGPRFTHFVQLGAEGHELARFDVADEPPDGALPGREPARWYAALLPPFVSVPGLAVRASIESGPRASRAWRDGFFALAALAAITGALATALVARRAALGRAATARWIAVGLVCGPAGAVAALGMLEPPPRAACAACGKRRSLARRTCQHCHAPLERPAPDGTEIWDAALVPDRARPGAIS